MTPTQTALRELEQHLQRDETGVISFATGTTYTSFFSNAAPLLARHPKFRATHLDEFIGLDTNASTRMVAELFRLCPPLERAYREGRFAPVPSPEGIEAHEATLAQWGGIALQFLGLGRNGHLAFNEPGAALDLGFHVTQLAQPTREVLAERFGTAPVPTHAVTAGLHTILSAKRIVLLATGASKAPAVARLLSKETSLDFPASCLHSHPNVLFLFDDAAAKRAR